MVIALADTLWDRYQVTPTRILFQCMCIEMDAGAWAVGK